jgi:hypothetical protein
MAEASNPPVVDLTSIRNVLLSQPFLCDTVHCNGELLVPGLTTEKWRNLVRRTGKTAIDESGHRYVEGTVEDVALAIWEMIDKGHGKISFAYDGFTLNLDQNNVTLGTTQAGMNLKQANAFTARWQQFVEFGRKWFDLLYSLDKVQERVRQEQERAARELREEQERAAREALAEWHRRQGEGPPKGRGVAPPTRQGPVDPD